MTKETGFYPRLRAATDEWMDLFGYWAPTVMTDPHEEYRAVRETAGFMDFSMLRKIDIEGPGAFDLVNSIVCRDLRKVPPGRVAYGPLVDENGRMVDDCTVSVRSADKIRFCGASDRDFEIFTERAKGTRITVREFTDEMPHAPVQGPKSRDLLQRLANRDLSNEVFPYYSFREDVEIAGIPVFMLRLGYTAELGYELWVERDRALELWDAVLEAGGPEGMKVVGMTALDLFRIEGGFIIGGIEYDPTVSPYECGLGWAVDLDKGDFLGKEALARDKEATTLRLTSVVLESGGDDASGAPLLVEAEEVGKVTQAIVSPYLDGKTLGLAKIRRDLNRAGTRVQARVGDDLVTGEVVRHPVYEPDRQRVHS